MLGADLQQAHWRALLKSDLRFLLKGPEVRSWGISQRVDRGGYIFHHGYRVICSYTLGHGLQGILLDKHPTCGGVLRLPMLR